MIINHRTAQLGVVNQKRPEVWQSYLLPQLQQEDVAKISMSISNEQVLRDIANDISQKEELGVVLSISDHKLIDPTKVENEQENLKVSLSISDHKLIEPIKTTYGNDDIGSISLGVGDHKLYIWGVRAEVLDEDNFKVSLAVGDHKLYEEQS